MPKKPKVSRYQFTVKVRYSPRYGEWVAELKEWPSCSWLDDTPQKAIKGIFKLIKAGLKDGDLDSWAALPRRRS